MAKMEQQRKLHPLGGHLSEMFKGISDQILESPEQSLPSTIAPASIQSTAQSYSSSSLDLFQNMTDFKDQKEIEPETPQPSTEQTRAAIQKTLDLVKSQKNTVKIEAPQDQKREKGFNSIAFSAGDLFKSLQSNFDIPDHEKNKEKMDEEKRARDLAAAIAQSSA